MNRKFVGLGISRTNFIVVTLGLILVTFICSRAVAQEVPKVKFNAECKTKQGKNISYDFSRNFIGGGITTDSGNGDVNLSFKYGISKAGEIRGYLEFLLKDAVNSDLKMSLSDSDAFVTEDSIMISDTLNQFSLRLQRTYKNEWHGIYTFFQYQETSEKQGDRLIAFTAPLKCKGDTVI